MREARRYLDRDLAEDASQETLVRAWRHAHACASENPEPWVRIIARREALRIAARRADDRPENEQTTGHSHIDLSADAVERIDVADALSGLPPNERTALFLHYWADMPHREIAAELSIPVGTAKVRVHRARLKLSRELGSEGQ